MIVCRWHTAGVSLRLGAEANAVLIRLHGQEDSPQATIDSEDLSMSRISTNNQPWTIECRRIRTRVGAGGG